MHKRERTLCKIKRLWNEGKWLPNEVQKIYVKNKHHTVWYNTEGSDIHNDNTTVKNLHNISAAYTEFYKYA